MRKLSIIRFLQVSPFRSFVEAEIFKKVRLALVNFLIQEVQCKIAKLWFACAEGLDSPWRCKFIFSYKIFPHFLENRKGFPAIPSTAWHFFVFFF